MGAQQWACTREQMIDALTRIKIEKLAISAQGKGFVLADSVADAILAQLPAVSSETEFACAYGGDDPNDSHLMCIDAEGCSAEEMTQWIPGSYVATRSVAYGPWLRFVPAPIGDPPF